MKKKTKPALRGLIYAIIAVVVLSQIYPILWVLASSIKTPAELAGSAPYSLPGSFYFGNYVRAFEQSNILRYLLNSTVVAILTIGITIVIGAPAAYAIEKLRFRAGPRVLSYLLIGLLVPIFIALLPMFQIFNEIGLRNTYWALVIPQVAFNLPLCVYLYSGFMRYIPDSLLEAARLDGATSFQIFRRIVFPLSANTTITIITFNFIFVWNEFVFANTFMTDPDMKTLPVGLNDFVGLYGKTDFGATYAAIVISILPTLILYFFLNKSVINGMASGAVRG